MYSKSQLCQAPAAHLVAYRTGEQEVVGSIPSSGNILLDDWWRDSLFFLKCKIVSNMHSYLKIKMYSFIDCHSFSKSWIRLTHSHTMTPFDTPGKQAFWKHCGKRRNCSQRAISPFSTVFSTRLDNFLPFSSNFKLSYANFFSLEESKICRLVMG